MLPAGAKLLAQGRFGKLRREITDGKSRLVPDARKGVLRAIRVRAARRCTRRAFLGGGREPRAPPPART